MTNNGPSCFACGGNESPFRAVLTELTEIYCDECAEVCPECEGENPDCLGCTSYPGLKLTHSGTVAVERNWAADRQAHADTLQEAGEGR